MLGLGAMLGARVPAALARPLAAWGPAPTALVWQPSPPVEGNAAAARRLAGGVLLLEGRLVESSTSHPWDEVSPDAVWSAALHGHGWLDDAAAADAEVWAHLAEWVWTWIERYGAGRGPGWRPDLVARRLTRWIAHSARLLRGKPPERSALFFRSLGMQARLLAWRWRETHPGLPRIEALSGLVYALISLEGTGRDARRAIALLGQIAERTVDQDGAVASRSPEDLQRIQTLLTWIARSLEEIGLEPAAGHRVAMQRAAPALAALTLPDGTLTRFHGGRGIRAGPAPQMLHATSVTMGYARLGRGASRVILDGAPPPAGPWAGRAHASALSFEFADGAQPIVINRGPGDAFGRDAALAARCGTAHSSVEVSGHGPERLPKPAPGPDAPLGLSGTVRTRLAEDAGGCWLMVESAQFRARTGLLVERRLHLTADGHRLAGEDTALATAAPARERLVRHQTRAGPLTLAARFHLHPDIRATYALAGDIIDLALPDGAHWLLRSDAARLEILPGICYDESRPKPRATSQIVASSSLIEYWGRITWSFERVPDTARPLRPA